MEVDVGAGGNELGNGQIASTTFGSGNAGSILLNVTGSVLIDAASPTFFTGLELVANSGSTGEAGDLRVNAASLLLTNGGSISASTLGLGRGGDVTVQIACDFVVTGVGLKEISTGISASTLAPNGGNAGRVAVTARMFQF